MRARLVAVADALEALVVGKVLAHPADVIAQSAGGKDTMLLHQQEGVPDWYKAAESLRNNFSRRIFVVPGRIRF